MEVTPSVGSWGVLGPAPALGTYDATTLAKIHCVAPSPSLSLSLSLSLATNSAGASASTVRGRRLYVDSKQYKNAPAISTRDIEPTEVQSIEKSNTTRLINQRGP
jgi:hypothetical protein